MIKPETYEAIRAGEVTELRTTKGETALGLEVDSEGDILGVVGIRGVFWQRNGSLLFPNFQAKMGDLTDDN